jgi:hypothetical protein
LPKKLKFLFIFLLFFNGINLFSNEILFLPANIEGDIRIRNQSISNLDLKKEFALLSSDIVNQDLLVQANISIEESEEPKNICNFSKVHFVVKDYFYFPQGQAPSVVTSVLNCSNSKEFKKESLLKGYVHQSLREHYKRVFNFIPPKSKIVKNSIKQKNMNLLLFVDASASMILEKQDLNSFVSDQIKSSSVDFYGSLISDGNLFSIKNSDLSAIPFAKNNSPEDLWIGFRKHLQSIQKLKEQNVQFILISPSMYSKSLEWITLINEGRAKGVTSYLLLPYNPDHSIYQKAESVSKATNSNTIPITLWKKIGLSQGEEKYLILNKGYLYFSNQNPLTLDKWNDFPKSRISVDDKITPYNMNAIYEKFSNQKIIQESAISMNLNSIMKNVISKLKYSESGDTKKILVRSNGEAIYIFLKKSIQISKNQKYILETNFFKDESNSWGIQNNPISTIIHPYSFKYPKLMEFKPSEAAEYLKRYNLDEIKTYSIISVEEIF